MPRPTPHDPGGARAAWADWLRRRMEAHEPPLSVRALAEACGVTPTAVQTWRSGGYPGVNVARRLALALGVSADELLEAADPVAEVVQ